MPWEETKEYIRSGHKDPGDFEKGSLRTITIDPKKGIKAIVGCPKGHFHNERCEAGMNVQSYLFAKESGWTMESARSWFEKSRR